MSKLSFIRTALSKHKYAAAIVFFIVLVGVLDENSLYHRFQNQQELHALRSEIRAYRDRYENDTKKLEELTTSTDAVRRVARERYLMRRPNEDIYVFADTTQTGHATVE